MTALLPILTVCGACFFAAACATLKQGARCGHVLLTLGAVCSALLVVANGLVAQAPPFGNMRHVLCLLPPALVIAGFRLRYVGVTAWCGIAGVAAVALCGAACMPIHAEWRQAPALRSVWFVPHVAGYVLAYALLALAFVYALGARGEARLSRFAAADALVRLAFPFLSFGLCSGMLWADEAWSRYWAWDIKEVWALLTWIVYLAYFHSPNSVPVRRVLIMLGFAAVVVTFIIVNFATNTTGSLHKY